MKNELKTKIVIALGVFIVFVLIIGTIIGIVIGLKPQPKIFILNNSDISKFKGAPEKRPTYLGYATSSNEIPNDIFKKKSINIIGNVDINYTKSSEGKPDTDAKFTFNDKISIDNVSQSNPNGGTLKGKVGLKNVLSSNNKDIFLSFGIEKLESVNDKPVIPNFKIIDFACINNKNILPYTTQYAFILRLLDLTIKY